MYLAPQHASVSVRVVPLRRARVARKRVQPLAQTTGQNHASIPAQTAASNPAQSHALAAQALPDATSIVPTSGRYKEGEEDEIIQRTY